MMDSKLINILNEFCGEWTSEAINNSGSNRDYYRIKYGGGKTLIAVHSPNSNETRAFLHFTKVLSNGGANVPKILLEHENINIYLLEDLGNTSLLDIILKRTLKKNQAENIELYKSALNQLAHIQYEAANEIDYSVAYPTSKMSAQSIMWDLNYFKYNFLKLTGIDFDERLLEYDFTSIVGIIQNIRHQKFVYRDFQSRNIMFHDEKLWFIDYQGGREGPCVYDLVSFVYQAKAGFSDLLKEELIAHYYGKIIQYTNYRREEFYRDVKFVRLLRAMQTLGAYGYRGLIEKKPHFVESMNLGIQNFIEALNECEEKTMNLPELNKIAIALTDRQKMIKVKEKLREEPPLNLFINSFSYAKNGIPKDKHGGGFVFDCRCLPNPFWDENLKHFSGLDAEVKEFFKSKQEVDEYLSNVAKIIEQAVNEYYQNGYESLMVSFGCTGGQHRSVYCADRIAEMYKNSKKIKPVVKHLQRKSWK